MGLTDCRSDINWLIAAAFGCYMSSMGVDVVISLEFDKRLVLKYMIQITKNLNAASKYK